MAKNDTQAQAQAEQDAPEAQAQEQHFGIEALIEATGATGKDVRRWLRGQTRLAGAGDTLPGKGGRYAFTGAQVALIAQAYTSAKARKGTTAPAQALAAFLAPPAPEGDSQE